MPGTYEHDAAIDVAALRAENAKLRRLYGHMRSEAGGRKLAGERGMAEEHDAAFVRRDDAALHRWLIHYGNARAAEAVLEACAAAAR